MGIGFHRTSQAYAAPRFLPLMERCRSRNALSAWPSNRRASPAPVKAEAGAPVARSASLEGRRKARQRLAKRS
jgi:hypothetical protein